MINKKKKLNEAIFIRDPFDDCPEGLTFTSTKMPLAQTAKT